MTSRAFVPNTATDTPERFPDFPPRDDMQNSIHLDDPAFQAALRRHFGNSTNVLVLSEIPVSLDMPLAGEGVRIPDLTIAFDVDRPDIIEKSGYAIDLVGKPPDFALEVASPHTARNDYTVKRRDYERFRISEYWRFDPTGGELYDVALAGDRLVGGRYEPVPVEWTSNGVARGYSEILRLFVCWEDGRLRFFDPVLEIYLLTYDDQADRADRAETRADRAELRADHAELGQRLAREEAQREAARAGAAEAEARRLRQLLRDLGHADE